MMKKLFMFLALVLMVQVAFAQARQITGTVTGVDDGETLAGVSVVVKGTTTGTITQMDGKYSIRASQGDVLVFAFIGMNTQEVTVGTDDVVNVTMSTDAHSIDEIMVVAYGTSTRKSFTGSASTVGAKEIEKRQVSDVSKALQGTSSGVQAVNLSGQPGTAATVRIRGVGSISASSNPLYVVDGVPFEGSLNSINTADIESMTVLKDAAANSLYGARGANGVILITTKKGQTGAPRVRIETRFGFNTRGIPSYDVVRDPGEYLELQWEALRNRAVSDGRANPNQWASDNLMSSTYGTGGYNPYGNLPANQVIVDGKLNSAAQLVYHDDWMKEPFKKGFRNEDIITISGGTDKTSYYISGGYMTDASYIPNSDFERYTARAKVEQEINSWFKTGLNVSYAKVTMNNPWSTSSAIAYSNLFMFAQQIAPIYPIWMYDQTTGQPLLDANGNKQYDFGSGMRGTTRPYGGNSNPLSALENDNNSMDMDNAMALGYAEVKFLKDFKFLARIGVESYNYFQNSYQTPVGGDALNVGGRNTRESGKYFAMNTQELLTWNREFGLHNVDVLVGHEAKKDKNNVLWARKENFLIPSNPELSNAARLSDASSYQNVYTIESYLSRAQYNYDEKYYVSASFRRDGSSRFSPDNRWGNFWSVGASWLINKESFMSSIDWVNTLKLKASYGTQGNDAILDANGYLIYNTYEDLYQVETQNEGDLAVSLVMRGNKDLKWESSDNFNVGVEFEFFERFHGGVEYYNKTTRDLIYRKPLEPSGGTPTWILDNAISMRNSGVEIELGYDILKGSDWLWQVKGNITSQKNEILSIPDDKPEEGYRVGDYWYKKGNSIYDWYTYKYAGVDPTTGRALWYCDEGKATGQDANGNWVTSSTADAKMQEVGKQALPKFYGGIETSVTWKGIDFSILTSFQIGGYGYDQHYIALMNNMSTPGSNVHRDLVERRWTTPGQITDVPRLEYGLQDQNALSDRFLVSRSCFSINNITLGYTLPKKITDRIKIDKLRVYATIDNLAVWSARKGYDPRVYISGTSTYTYSAMRTFSMGLNINF